ncbi:MAG: hypothetical protein V8S13_06840 [Gemmiger formicilis]
MENEELLAEVTENLATLSEATYRNKKRQELVKLTDQEEQQREDRTRARNHFNQKYPVYDFADPEIRITTVTTRYWRSAGEILNRSLRKNLQSSVNWSMQVSGTT